MSLKHFAIAAAAAAALAFTAPQAALAQSGSGASATQDGAQFSDAQLDAFADAWLSVRDIANAYQPQLQSATDAGDEAEMQRLREAANEEMRAAVEASADITVEEYRSVITTARSDEQFATRLRTVLENAVKEQQQ